MDAISDPIQTGQAAGPRKSWRDFTRIHEACALIPEMSDAELDALGDDLVKNSLTASIAFTPDGQLLDGRSRLDALGKKGVLVALDFSDDLSIAVEGDDAGIVLKTIQIKIVRNMSPWTFVVSANLHRRHLTAEKKWELIEALLKADPSTPDRQIAKAVNASPTYIGKVRKQAEKRGDVSTVDTRTDTKGRKQPARKPKAQPILPAVEIHEPQLDSVARNADFSDEPEAPTTNMVAPIKATLELMAQAAEAIVHFGTIAGKQFTDARDQFETEEAFDAWLAENKLGRDRVSALLVIGEHPDLARSIMTLIDEMLFNAFQRFTAEGQG